MDYFPYARLRGPFSTKPGAGTLDGFPEAEGKRDAAVLPVNRHVL